MNKVKKLSRRVRGVQRSAAEAVTFAISVLLLAGVIGGLLWLELGRGDQHARITVIPAFDSAYEFEGDWYLPVTITNEGDRATDALRVDLVRPIPGEAPEVAELEYTFVAGGEQVEGTAIFDERPTSDSIEVDVMSITEP